MRTFGADAWHAAQRAWDAGEYDDDLWRPFREHAARRGFIYPPEGTRWDSWDERDPSQRAIVARAIDETPHRLHEAIEASRSWRAVVAKLCAARDELIEEGWARQDAEAADAAARPGRREALQSLGSILGAIRGREP